MKKVLILHISDSGGHKKASENIEEALRYKSSDLDILNINGFGYITPYTEKIVNFFYTKTIKHFPFLWGSIYDRKRVIKGLNPINKLVNKIGALKISNLLFNFDPDVVLTTQGFPCGFISQFKTMHNLSFPLVAVVTDYYPHRFWINPGVDVYTVACPEAKDKLVSEGVSPERIKIAGIPISVKFLKAHRKEEVVRELGLRPDLPTVLLMGGNLGIGPIEKVAKILDSLKEQFQVIVVCGCNKKLYQWFESYKPYFSKPFFYFGYIDFVHKLMDVSDVIITKGGGLTTSEALAKGMATIVINPIPGQEERNTAYLKTHKAVMQAADIEDIPRCLSQLIGDKKKMFTLKENAAQHAIVDSSLRIANLVLKLLD